jgi:aminoglycoside phosphotransferase
VAEVIEVGRADDLDWMVTGALPGLLATDSGWGDHRAVVVALGRGLRRLHVAAPRICCPFDFRIPAALEHVRQRAGAGLIDAQRDLHDEHRHLDLPAAMELLNGLQPNSEDPVVCHGDYCVPNVLLAGAEADPEAVGYVDLGELGVADRWWDLAVAT